MENNYARAFFVSGAYILEAIPKEDKLFLHRGVGVMRGTIVIKTEEPIATATLSDVGSIVTMALRHGIDVYLMAQFIGEDVLDEWRKRARSWKQLASMSREEIEALLLRAAESGW